MIVGTAEVAILADDAGFAASLEAGTAAPLAGLAAEAKVAGDDLAAGLATSGEEAGLAAGTGLRGGAKEGLTGLEDDVEATGGKISGTLGDAYQDSAGRWRAANGQFLSAADQMAMGVGKSGEEAGEKLEQGIGGGLSKAEGAAHKSGGAISSALGALGVPEALLGGWGKVGIALVATGALAVGLGAKMQSAETQIATASGTSVAAAKAIGNAFLATGGQTEFSGLEQAKAYASVAGQLKSTQGQALTTAQAMGVMTAAGELATAKQISLGDSTKTLATTMQAFQVSAKGAAGVSDILFNASNATGQGIDAVGASLDKVKGRLGAVAPPIGQLAGLLVDLTNHGESGRAAMQTLSGTFTAFLKPVTDQTTAQAALKAATDSLPPSLQKLAQQYATGTMTAAQVSAATKGLTTSQQASWTAFTQASTAAQASTASLDKMGISAVGANGKLKPMGDIVGQLNEQIKGMTTAQAIAQLQTDGFSGASAKLVQTIQAGPAAYDKATASVTKVGAAHNAAAEQSKTLGVEMKTLTAEAEDWATKLGSLLIPALSALLHGVMAVVPYVLDFGKAILNVGKYIADHKVLLVGLAAAVGAVLVPVLATLAVSLGTAAAAFVVEAAAAAAAWIATMGPIALVVAAIALVAMGVYEVIEHWSAIAGFFEKLWHDVAHGVTVAFGAVVGFFQTIWDDVEHDATSIWNTIVGFFKHYGELILLAFVPIVGIPLFLATHWNQVMSDASSIWGAIVGFFTSIPGKLLDALASLGDLLLGWITSAIGGLRAAVVGLWNAEVSFWTSIPGKVIGALAGFGAMLVGWIESAFAWLGAAERSGLATAVSFFEGLPGKILAAVGDLGSTLLSAGEDVMRGLVQGIENGVGWVGSALGKVADKIKSFITNPLGIFSPSTVFAGYGDNLMQGLAIGIERTANRPLDAVRKVSANLADVGPEAMGASLGPGTAGGAPGVGHTVIVNVHPGAVVISGLDPNTASSAQESVNQGFNQLARELASGQAPTRIGAP